MNMLDLAMARLLARRCKKYWVAALCAGSFACGHYLFGADDDESESLLSQYQQATQQLVTEVQPTTAGRTGPATTANSHSSRLQPAKAQAASVATPGQSVLSNAPAPQQKSSRRVKPPQPATPESPVAATSSPSQPSQPAGAEPLAKADAPANAEHPATDESSATEQPSENQPELVQRAPAAPAAPQPRAVASADEKPLPTVAYVPQPSTVTQKQLAPRMEILTPATAGDQSPRAQDPAMQNAPLLTTKPAPTQAEVWLPANPVPSQPLPQVINVSRQAVAPPQPPKLASTLAELNDNGLPPIVSPDQVPRPGMRKKQTPPAAQATPILRIDLGKK
jgi:hypothetical protein